MKKVAIAVLVALVSLFIGCKQDVEKQAQPYLDKARSAYYSGAYAEAKAQIDNVRVLYPKAIETRRQGLALMQQVEIAEQHRTLQYVDSVMQQKLQQREALLPRFVLEKDTHYQEVGNYSVASQKLERNLGRNYLRAQVDERGRMVLTSFYHGSPLHHKALKVSAGGTFAQTPPSDDLYETSDAVSRTERNDFVLGKEGEVIAFIALQAGSTVKVDYLGEKKTYTTTLSKADVQAVADVYQLAQVLQAIEELKKMQDEATRKLKFIESKVK